MFQGRKVRRMNEISESGPEPGISPAEGGGEVPRWWESSEEHRFALEVLQLRIRRDILKFIGERVRSAEEVAEEFGIPERQAAFHLAMLEKGLVIEPVTGGYRSTPTGQLYLERVEGPSSG
ncbi:winged helix-turn-helix domain-containing protein [Methanocrinis sp.]|uniref:winged helix-turn-helix domain-containing protein n=1 Tax=Methanocrinis sp. TaxID=3101522 RepID=UPI003D13F8FB